jgi:TolB-like protein/Tfp pilus assembly protein PilF/tRNA A-37 threonylcarbamoyl transferase component Bud32
VPTKCPKCQFENPDDTFYCGKCGGPLPSSKEVPVSQTETLQTPRKELTTGSTFAGRYQIIEELGQGGMGKVYKAFDKEVNVRVALKLVKPEIAADKNTIERFRNELKVAREISHKNICRMYDLGRDAETYFITMEYVSGEDLRSFIRRARRLDIGTAISITRQVCDGLSEAHRLGVVHRDLKPSNIMIDQEGNAKIMDFGIARSLKGKGITGAGVMIGTPEYMSPEQVEGKEADERSDLYALGVILYEMVTGRVPFEGDTLLSVAVKHKSEIPKDPRELNVQLPEDLSCLILRCLEKDKEKRFQSAAEVSAELEKIERGVITGEKTGLPGKAKLSIGKTRPFQRKKFFVPALTAVAFIVIGFILWRVLPGKRDAGPMGVPSVAVLPFEDLSPQKDQEYFCDGMTEELINRLSNIRGLKVPARTSVFMFKGKASDIRDIGKRLNVQTVLEGSIRKIDNQLRVTAQLINISDGFHLWSETYNRELKDVFNIWDEIALTIADRLKLTLLSDERARIMKRPTENLEAYNLYLLGRYFLDRASVEEDFNKVIGYFEQAIAKDPGYALAYVGLAVCYSNFCMIGYLAPNEGYPKAIEAAKKALELDDELGEAHASLGYLKFVFDWDIAGAEDEFKRALKLSPGSSDVYIPYSMYLALTGRFEEAIAGFKRVVELDPAAPGYYVYLGGWGYQMAGRYDESIAQIKKGLDMDPSILYGQLFLASAYALKGMYEEAAAQADKAISAWPRREDVQIFTFLGWVYAVSGQQKKARDLLNRMLDLRTKRYLDAYLIGEVYAGLGEKDKAFEWLNKAYEERAGQMIFLKVDPWIKNLHSDPRYKELLRKMGFEK